MIKKKHMLPLKMDGLFFGIKDLGVKETYGALDRLKIRSSPRSTLLEAVAYFEDYLGWLTFTVLKDFPSLLRVTNPSSDKEEVKLINLILESVDKAEILDRIIEEKVRSIFYGNPIDFFLKSKSKLHFNKYFEVNSMAKLEELAEIFARRNIVAHNDGRVDRKYLREVATPKFKFNQSVSISDKYLQDAIMLMSFFSAKATELVVKNHYGAASAGILARRLKAAAWPAI